MTIVISSKPTNIFKGKTIPLWAFITDLLCTPGFVQCDITEKHLWIDNDWMLHPRSISMPDYKSRPWKNALNGNVIVVRNLNQKLWSKLAFFVFTSSNSFHISSRAIIILLLESYWIWSRRSGHSPCFYCHGYETNMDLEMGT